ncbi:hypothetical protein HG535_0D02010 [Zygotorulaspora mrakii]|uniref:R3H domain-containing protein n=1 Tax=Zygotorulaspora mrakii TaxID=42260 RepID=A0A7H9B1W7_ZYGMR|nr:uncharacterized protein HG535_0D02010 [Zygotorulaspora mrakii]QLG72493.1 hypothetical protein HG535_0D02010 [Zygotorulaspora mrakii]
MSYVKQWKREAIIHLSLMTIDNLVVGDIDHQQGHVSNVGNDEEMAFYEKSVREIARGDSYVCMICTVEMDYTCSMYACGKCYRVYDYECIREWALKSTKRTADGSWKCPNCLHVSKQVPAKDKPRCWCGKVVRPDANPMDPNSCGQTCNARICRHGCSQICHLGPHEECMRTISIKCRCGKHKKDVFCHEFHDAKERGRFRCENKCGKSLHCGRHACKRLCHSKSCGPCPEVLTTTNTDLSLVCYCGNTHFKSIKCKDIRMAKKPSENANGDTWVGLFSCSKIRSVEYSCHQHSFLEGCKSNPSIDGKNRCPFSPKFMKTCPCGKTTLKHLTTKRKVCTDPIFTCESRCGKKLRCGKHTCPFKCHEGPCMDPCIQTNILNCSCQQRKFITPCNFKHMPSCNIKCESLMSCRRHRCIERCCSGKPAAEVRRKTPYGSNELQDESLVEAEHICLKDCNLMLSCGKHKCQRKCHPGKCPPCLESSSDDLVCPCGKTVVEAPVRCGTKLPTCDYPCIKVVQGLYQCGHKPMPHTCHPLDRPCPPCTAPVQKRCKCGKRDTVRTVCFQNDVSCGQICNKPLQTCRHNCQKLCHSPGNCQRKCKGTCNAEKKYCDHKCTRPCHGKESCPDTPCTAIIKITCSCGLLEKEVVCGAFSRASSPACTESLPCDDSCEMRKRQLELKTAFGISDEANASSTSGLISHEKLVSSATTFEELELPFTEVALNVYSKHFAWCSSIEKVLNSFMDDSQKNSLHFKPMKPPQRSFIHELAKAYKLYSESQDREPKRSVYINKMEGSGYGKPLLSLNESLPIYVSFKELEKERKSDHFESKTTVRLINYTSMDTPKIKPAEKNAFIIKNIARGTTEQDLERIFSTYLKHTLVKNPRYKLDAAGKTAFIFPEDYTNVNVNVQEDLERLVGHFDFIIKDLFVAETVGLCKFDVRLLAEDQIGL